MLHTRTEIGYRTGAAAAILPTIALVDTIADESTERHRQPATEQALDQILADSFPASDPPSWNSGTAVLEPAVSVAPDPGRLHAVADIGDRTRASDIVDVSRPDADRSHLQGLVSFAAAAGIALFVPFGILLVAVPIALSIRGALELVSRLFGVVV